MDVPLWKRAYDEVEKQAAPVITKLLARPDVLEALTIGMAVQRRARQDIGELIRRSLHTVNLPSGTDVRDVSNQIAGLERQIRSLNRRIDQLQREAGE